MFIYNFNIRKLIRQNCNPNVVKGSVVDFVEGLLKPLKTMKEQFLSFVTQTRETEKWTFQIMSLERLLNDKFAIGFDSIRIETLRATNVKPLSSRFSQSSFLNDRGKTKPSFFLPSKEGALLASGINDHFVVYANQDVLDASSEEIIETINYYKMEGLRFQLRATNDQINALTV